ncbi:IS66 family insertion sequence element accessory protein TnpB [Janthinobacterium sp. GMG1]|uniref:IS66 family insertion sequence element accessory protein TnpB n=1 Tax=Janthinobacterium sp. GMG1 TaxID=3096007 RepID=UPI003A1024BD
MIGLSAGTKIWLAAGLTDMRAGMNGLAAKAQTALAEDPTTHELTAQSSWVDLWR